MTLQAKRELLAAVRPRYRKAHKAEKSRILDEFVANTGYHRKHAIRLLKHGPPPRRAMPRRPRRSPYRDPEVVRGLVFIWKTCDYICSRRLQPHLPEMIAAAMPWNATVNWSCRPKRRPACTR